MTYREREMTYTNALARYGEENQLVVAIEELSELQKEVTKFLRGIGNAGDLAEETADALICIEQLIYIFGIREMVEVQMDRKVMRLDDTLRREALAFGSKNQPGDCHGALPLAMTGGGSCPLSQPDRLTAPPEGEPGGLCPSQGPEREKLYERL